MVRGRAPPSDPSATYLRPAPRPDRLERDSLLPTFSAVAEDEEEEMEEMLQAGPAGKEWGGPTRGGVLGEPTRFGDWERKGRCSDF